MRETYGKIYEASDGSKFISEAACIIHERDLITEKIIKKYFSNSRDCTIWATITKLVRTKPEIMSQL